MLSGEDLKPMPSKGIMNAALIDEIANMQNTISNLKMVCKSKDNEISKLKKEYHSKMMKMHCDLEFKNQLIAKYEKEVML